MQNQSLNVDLYNSTLKSEVIKLSIIAVALVAIFAFIIIYSIIEIKSKKSKSNKKAKIIPYIQLFAAIGIFVFLSVSLGSQIVSFSRDLAEEAYILYEGPANVRTENRVIFGGLPTGYTEYIISFEQNGKSVELYTRKDYGLGENMGKVYIVYSQYTNSILEFEVE